MNEPARLALAVALLASLLALQQAVAGGLPATLAAATCLALGGAAARRPRTRRPRRPRVLASALPALAVALAASVAAATLIHLAVRPAPPLAVAWLPRTLALGAALLLPRTPTSALPLHALAVLLALWTAAALAPTPPPLPVLAPALLALAATARGLQLARTLELGQAASASLAIGVAPTPWGVRPARAPAGVIVGLAALPLAIGLELPRLRRAPPLPASSPAAGPAATSAARSSAPPTIGTVGFTPTLRFDLARAPLDAPERVVARVRLAPDERDELLLRGAVLERVVATGFEPAREPGPSLGGERPTAVAWVELLELPDGACALAPGPVHELKGAAWRAEPSGPRLLGSEPLPLRYEARYEQLPVSAPPGDFRAARLRADLLALPAALAADPELGALADEVAWGRSAAQRARSAERWLLRQGRYDAGHAVPAGDLHARLRAFLLGERRGVCADFAAAFAVLLRRVGVPARVVTGYRTRERDADGRFVVRAWHAHAWVEVGLEGAGWIPFDPTPPASSGVGPRGGAAAAEAATTYATSAPVGGGPAPRDVLARRGVAVLLTVGLVAALLAALAAPARARRRVAAEQLARGSAPVPELDGLRARLFAALVGRGLRLGGAETPLELLARRRVAGLSEPELEAAVAAYNRLRFGPPCGPGEAAAARAALQRVRA